MLPIATLVYNNACNSTTGFSPNKLISRIEPTTIPKQATASENPIVKQRVDQLREWQLLTTQALNKAVEKARPIEACWKQGQKV
jgi:hypothetical protein